MAALDTIYFDNNATTRPLDEVVAAMQPFWVDAYANPSSVHQFGQSVKHAIECAREQVAALIHANPGEIVFTSSGTESINLAIRGALAMVPTKRKFVTTAVEHAAVVRLSEELDREGYEVILIGVDRDGRIDEEAWLAAMTDDTALASIQHANNETGVMMDVPRLAELAQSRGVAVHVDAVQTVGKVAVNVTDWPIQFASFSAHKFHGPKGAGGLYVRRRTRLKPLIVGGSQERELRAGTENTAAIVGMGVAATCCGEAMVETAARVGALRDQLERDLVAAMSIASVNGSQANRVYNTTNISFENLEAEAILILLSEAGIYASSGAACSSGSLQPSHVLQAMGTEASMAHGAIRFSLSRYSNEEEVVSVVERLPGLLARLSRLGSR